MTSNSPNNSPSNFENGKLKPGIYKIQNLYSQTYLDIHEHSWQACCRPARNLGEGRGLIMPLEAGYSIQRVEPGKPKQFCTPTEGVSDGAPLYVGAYPVAWRIEIDNDNKYSSLECVRIFWGATNRAWDLDYGGSGNGTKVVLWIDGYDVVWRIWKLVLVKAEGMPTPSQPSSGTFVPGPLPPYGGDAAGQLFTRTQHAESEGDNKA